MGKWIPEQFLMVNDMVKLLYIIFEAGFDESRWDDTRKESRLKIPHDGEYLEKR